MKLLIVESPAKSKTISKYLGGDYKVVASVGHIRDLPKSNKKAIDIPSGFVPHYEISKGKEKVVEEIKSLAKKADEILLATDPDREGEAIAWHFSELIKGGLDKSKIKRVTYHEITKEAIEEALKHPRKIDENLKEAQEARRVLDRLVGYDLSGLIWKKVRYGLSAGRVQSPALRIIMEREREIREFKPESFWVINANLLNQAKVEMPFVCNEEPKSEEEAEKIVAKGKAGSWKVLDITETNVKRAPKAPFITSTLQQAASSRLGFSPARTMGIAQKLYEAGHITYMRTDSTNLAQSAVGQIRNVVEKNYGADLFEVRLFSKKAKNAQEAHEAIRPTHFDKDSLGANDEQKKLYNLIWARTVASQMKDALTLRTKIEANIEEGGIPNFSSNGQRVIFEGWLKADPKARGEDVELPKTNIGDKLNLKDIQSEGKETQPPNRYSEAGLVKELEKRGIGRPSTYASIIKTLIDREYVVKDSKALVPTDTGDVVSTFLEQNFESYISDNFTAEMEDKLDLIAEGKAEYLKTLEDFYSPFLKDVKSKDKLDKITNLGDADPKLKCPTCGSNMIIKLGRGGKFLSCQRFPECKGMRDINGEEIKEAESIGTDPKTGLPIFVMDGRFGPYVQLGDQTKTESDTPKEKGKKTKKEKPRRASIPKDKNPNEVTLEEALKYLSLPRELGVHPETGDIISANIGRFGPYIVHQSDFRSLKEDDVYTIELPRALEIFKEPKKAGSEELKRKVNDRDTKEIFAITNLTKEEKSLIEKAYNFAKEAHKDQKRNSGEPYFNHLFATAKNIAELSMDGATIAAGFLHDTLEDTKVTPEQIEKEFGKEVRFMVEGVTKIGNLRYHGKDKHNESLRKLLLATSEDIRVLIVKLCDRLHNIRTLEFVPEEKQYRIARETIEIYAPIAYRLGIRKLSRELEDLSFPFVNKEGYEEITSLTQEREKERFESLDKFRKSVAKELVKSGFSDFKIDYRVKGTYSLYKKYIKNKKDFDRIYDILAMRITVKEQADCYKLLGMIHSNWKPMPGRIKDYIAFPKVNGYKSLHTTVFTGNGDVVEIQIRTEDMHKEAEYGVASHASYKAEEKDKRQVSSWIKNISDNNLKEIKEELLSEKIFVFTPKGDVVDLPVGSSTIDFAYSIHSDIGNHIAGAKINNKMSSLDTILKNGDIVEIITSKNSKPKHKWLEYTKTSLAKRHIKNFEQH